MAQASGADSSLLAPQFERQFLFQRKPRRWFAHVGEVQVVSERPGVLNLTTIQAPQSFAHTEAHGLASFATDQISARRWQFLLPITTRRWRRLAWIRATNQKTTTFDRRVQSLI
jgi:hypothetical protein